MYQVTFSEQSMHELSKLDTRQQMELIEPISSLTPAELDHPREPIGRVVRGRKVFYRLRAGEFRLYFEKADSETLYCHYILHKNTLTDFIFRSRLPVTEEQMVEQHHSFWKYLEGLKK